MLYQPLTADTSTFEAGEAIENFDFDRVMNAEENNINNFNVLDDHGIRDVSVPNHDYGSHRIHGLSPKEFEYQLKESLSDRFLSADASFDFEFGICRFCAHLEKAFFRPNPEKPRVKHHASFENLESSATHGCKLCKLFKDSIFDSYIRCHPKNLRTVEDVRDELLLEDSVFELSIFKHGWAPTNPKNLQGVGRYEFALHTGCNPTNIHPRDLGREHVRAYDSLEIRREKSDYPTVHVLFMIGTQPNRDDFLAKGYQGSQVTRAEFFTVGDPAFSEGNFYGREITRRPNFQLARAWIKKCRDKHSCEQLDSSSVGPTRLLYLRPQEKGHFTGKLIETNGEPYAYVCLSHRWSSSLKYMTSKENYYDQLRELNCNSLPAVFRDAMHSTLALGYNFLWIDCLCIVQDDLTDWESECPKMARIYAGAQVTIAAPGAADSESGFLGARFAGKQAPSCILRYRDRVGTVTGRVKLWYPAFNGSWTAPRDPEKDSILDTRGWILQERILSSRVLYFGSRQLYLECNSCTYFEVLQYPVFHSADWDDFQKGRLKNRNTKELLRWWLRIVDDFAKRTLTFPADKLPALSGIASVIHNITKGEYLAGVWREDLAAGLIWQNLLKHNDTDSTVTEAVQPYRAPTWSWARSDCGTAIPMIPYWEGESGHLCFEVLSADIELAGQDPFGQVKGGYLKVRGKTRKGVIRRKDDSYGGEMLGLFDPGTDTGEVEEPIDFNPDSSRFEAKLKSSLSQQGSENDYEGAEDIQLEHISTVLHKEDHSLVEEIEVQTLWVSRPMDEAEEMFRYDHGMVLMPADDEPAYVRVGLISDKSGWFENNEEMILRIV